jgi:hypothetical protein
MIVLYKGARGRGKTLTMIKDALQYQLDGWRVFTNMENSRIGTFLSTNEILKIDKQSTIQQCVLVIDEIQSLFDSRRSMRKENLSFSYFIQQIRKRGIILLCTTQYMNTVDLRLRQHIDVLAIPRINRDLDVCSVRYIDMTSIEDEEYGIAEPNSTEIVYSTKEIYGLYDTKEIIV